LNITYNQYKLIKIYGKSYWIFEIYLDLEKYGEQRVILSKNGQFKNPIFLTTNSDNCTAKQIVKYYLRRFSIEVFFKDAKQFLNFETFLYYPELKWELHLVITNILHWGLQKRKSISKIVRKMRD